MQEQQVEADRGVEATPPVRGTAYLCQDIARRDGVIAVYVTDSEESSEDDPFLGDEDLRAALRQAAELWRAVPASSRSGNVIRVVVGRISINTQQERGLLVIVAMHLGHEIAKSLRRMIVRTGKRAFRPQEESQD